MTRTAEAMIEPDGTVRLLTPLAVAEPTRAVVSVSVNGPDPRMLEALRRIESAKTFDEWRTAAEAGSRLLEPDGYALVDALETNRRLEGSTRPLFPETDEGTGS